MRVGHHLHAAQRLARTSDARVKQYMLAGRACGMCRWSPVDVLRLCRVHPERINSPVLRSGVEFAVRSVFLQAHAMPVAWRQTAATPAAQQAL